MPGCPRKDVVREGEIGIYHTWSRCVQGAFLLGEDPLTGQDYSHRRQWLESLIQYQTSIFCIDVGSYAILSNHFHLIGRTRPDLVNGLSDYEVAWRWRMAWPQWADGQWLREPTDQQLKELLVKPEKILKIRQALSSLSWFMARIKEPIARLANAEAGTKGHYYESRFGCRELVDDEGVLVAFSYNDLNLLKAGLASSLEDSHFSAIERQLRAWLEQQASDSLTKFQGLANSSYYPLEQEQIQKLLANCFLAPISDRRPPMLEEERPALILPESVVRQLQEEPSSADESMANAAESTETVDSQRTPPEDSPVESSAKPDEAQVPVNTQADKRKRRKRQEGKPTWEIHKRLWARRRCRPSDDPILTMPFEVYLERLLRQIEILKGQQTPPALPVCAQQQGAEPDKKLSEAIAQFEKFGRAVGKPQNVERLLKRNGRRWLHGLRRCRATFS